MKEKEKVLILKSILKITILMVTISAILKLFGFNFFKLDANNKIMSGLCVFLKKYHLINILKIILLIIENYIMFKFACKNTNTKTYWFAAITISLLNFLSQVFIFEKIGHNFYTISMMILFIVFASIIDKKLNLKRPLIVIVVICIYQLLTMFIREVTVNYDYEEIYYFLLNFDYIILLLISYFLFLKKDIKLKEHNEYDISIMKTIDRFPTFEDLKHHFTTLKEKFIMFKDAPKHEKIFVLIYVFLLILSELFNLTLIVFIAYLNGTIIECVFIISSFLITKKVFGTPFHFDSAIKCWIVSNITYYILNRITFNVGITFVIPIMLGITLSFITSKFVKENNSTIYRGIPLEDFNELCKGKKLNKVEKGILKDFYCNKMSIDKLTFKYNYSRSAIFQHKAKALKKLES